MDARFKECMKPHAFAHSLTGFGVAFILLAFVPSLAGNALMIGIIAFVLGFILDYMKNPAK